jgi:hypothetical protein
MPRFNASKNLVAPLLSSLLPLLTLGTIGCSGGDRSHYSNPPSKGPAPSGGMVYYPPPIYPGPGGLKPIPPVGTDETLRTPKPRRCPRCGGRGDSICSVCRGLGQRDFSRFNVFGEGSGKVEICSSCGGTGKVVCTYCDGTGNVDF